MGKHQGGWGGGRAVDQVRWLLQTWYWLSSRGYGGHESVLADLDLYLSQQHCRATLSPEERSALHVLKAFADLYRRTFRAINDEGGA